MNDRDFLDCLGNLEIEAPYASKNEINRTLALALERSGLRKKRRAQRARRILLIAAIVTTGTLAVAAAYYSASDAFRGVLKEQDTKGNPAPIASTAPVLDEAGTVIGKTVSASDINVTVRAAVFNRMGYKVLVDVQTVDGSPLTAPKSSRASNYTSRMFRKVNFGVVGEKRHAGGMAFNEIEGDYADGHATFLMEGDGLPEDSDGKTGRLELTDLSQCVTFDLMTDPADAVGEPSLYDLYQKLEPADLSEFEAFEVTKRDGTVDRVEYRRKKLSDRSSVSFSALFPEQKADTVLVKDGWVYICGTGPKNDDFEHLTHTMVKDLRTGEIVRVSGGGGSYGPADELGGNEELSAWTLRFDGIEDVEALKNYTLVRPSTGKTVLTIDGKGAGPREPDDTMLDLSDYMVLGIAKGEWTVEFPLKYGNIEKVVKPKDVVLKLKDDEYTVERVCVTPFSVGLDLQAKGEVAPLPDDIARQDRVIWLEGVLGMEGGVNVAAKSYLSLGQEYIEATLNFDVVIDPKEAKSITIGKTMIPLG